MSENTIFEKRISKLSEAEKMPSWFRYWAKSFVVSEKTNFKEHRLVISMPSNALSDIEFSISHPKALVHYKNGKWNAAAHKHFFYWTVEYSICIDSDTKFTGRLHFADLYVKLLFGVPVKMQALKNMHTDKKFLRMEKKMKTLEIAPPNILIENHLIRVGRYVSLPGFASAVTNNPNLSLFISDEIFAAANKIFKQRDADSKSIQRKRSRDLKNNPCEIPIN